MDLPDELPPDEPEAIDAAGRRRRWGVLLGLAVFAILWAAPAPGGMSAQAWKVAAVAALMAIWWISEALPVAATALVPLVLFPAFGIAPIKETAAPYANPLIFLFMGGFMIALAMERWGLHKRIALAIVTRVGTRPERLIAGFMIASAGLSMWVSNTATTVVMLPIGLSIIAMSGIAETKDGRGGFPVALLLGIAYAASIGGLATLIGSPPNALLAAYVLETESIRIGFAQWMAVGVPLSLVLLAICWWLLTRFLFSLRDISLASAATVIDEERARLGPMSRGERIVAVVFVLTAFAWVFRPAIDPLLPGLHLTDEGIAVAAAIILFAAPVDLKHGEFALNWDWAKRLPWGVLILFGGGLSLASAISATGLATWIGEQLSGIGAWPLIAAVAIVTGAIILLTELTSNTATAAAFLPIIGGLAQHLGHDPMMFTVPAVLAASCAFMLPVATPPNAIVYGSGHISVPQMARAGIWMNIVGTVIITLAAMTLIPAIFG